VLRRTYSQVLRLTCSHAPIAARGFEGGPEAIACVVADESNCDLGVVAWLGAVRGRVFLAALACGIGVVGDGCRGLGQRAACEVGAERAGLNDDGGDAQGHALFAQRKRERFDRGFDRRVVARALRAGS
jgi:hypothetical protein